MQIEVDLVWIIIFVWTAILSSFCTLFGLNLITKEPRRWSSSSLGMNFVGHAINFLMYPFIILDPNVAIWAYKVQVIGYMIAVWTSFTFARSLTVTPSKKFCIITMIPAFVIIMIVWLLMPFTPYSVAYGYELRIDLWFMASFGTFGYIAFLYLIIELIKLYRGTTQEVIKRRLPYLIGGYLSLTISMTLLLTVLPMLLEIGEIKPFGVFIATISLILVYRGYRPAKGDSL